MNNQHFNHTHKNLLCGDTVTVTGTVQNGILVQIAFTVAGCSLCQKAADVLAQKVLNQPITSVRAITEEQVPLWLELELGPMRLACALTPLQALKTALLRTHDQSQ